MKLKYITLISLFVFVGTILFLGVWPSVRSDSAKNTDIKSLTPVENESPLTTTANITLTREEIARHNTREDCYIIIKDSVYSVASFINQHPGGARKILDMCGQEATTVFAAIHSNFAWNLLSDFYIGKVGETIGTQNITPTTNTSQPVSNTKQKYDDDKEVEYEYEKD